MIIYKLITKQHLHYLAIYLLLTGLLLRQTLSRPIFFFFFTFSSNPNNGISSEEKHS